MLKGTECPDKRSSCSPPASCWHCFRVSARPFIALFGGQIRAELGIGHGTFGSLYALATLTSGFAMLWAGAAVDRISLRAYAAIGAVLLAAASLLLAVTQSAALLVLALFGLRLAGQGMLSHASLTGMARAFLRNRGKAIALATLGHPAGEAVLPILAVTATAAFAWHSVWIGAACMLVLAAPLLVRLLRDANVPQPIKTGSAGDATAGSYTRGAMLRDGRFDRLAGERL